MAGFHLVVANKNYSSWSLRPWLAMHELGIPFTETVIALDTPKTARQIARHSGAGRLPVLHHGKITVWESLAILEYLAERFPEKAFWPRSAAARAMARAVANEMHAGFAALRNALPMNLRRPRKPLAQAMGEDVRRNVSRIETLWSQCRNAHGRGGPFLFGKFGIADAMYAPVVTRFDTYAVKVGRDARAYMDAILATKGIQAWKSDAIKEQWVIAADEVD
jgi:glutathione S-transferase